MKIVIVDLAGRNSSQYNPSLCKELASVNNEGSVTLMSPTLKLPPEGYKWVKLISLVPESLQSSLAKWKKGLRAIEVLLNYFYTVLYLVFFKPDIIHFQWLPFLQYANTDSFFIRIIRHFLKNVVIVLTAHNIYPHNMQEDARVKYAKRFQRLDKLLDGYMVHLESARENLHNEFGIQEDKIFVTYHGIFKCGSLLEKNTFEKHDRIRVIMYGYQTKYKGADILIDSLEKLDEEYRSRIECTIVGKTEQGLYKLYEQKAKSLNVSWINRYVSDDELYSYIAKSDLILLPYRSITQSGVLLLALSYRKPILTSNLPSFIETLKGYPEDCFFESDNPDSLCSILRRFIDGDINKEIMLDAITELNKLYSWNETAKSTIKAYASCVK